MSIIEIDHLKIIFYHIRAEAMDRADLCLVKQGLLPL